MFEIEESQVSVCSLEQNNTPTWKKICKKYTKELKKKYEQAYAFGLYKVYVYPPEKIKDFTCFAIGELKIVSIQRKTTSS